VTKDIIKVSRTKALSNLHELDSKAWSEYHPLDRDQYIILMSRTEVSSKYIYLVEFDWLQEIGVEFDSKRWSEYHELDRDQDIT